MEKEKTQNNKKAYSGRKKKERKKERKSIKKVKRDSS